MSMVHLNATGGLRPRHVGLGFRRERSGTATVLGQDAAVWRSRKVPGLILETADIDGQRRYVLRLQDVVVFAWNRLNGWSSQFRSPTKWKNQPYDPEIQIGAERWQFEFDEAAKDTAHISVGKERWVLERVRLLKFRLAREATGDEVFFGPNLGARGLVSWDQVTVVLACMLQLLQVEQMFSSSYGIRMLAVVRRFVAFYFASP